MLFSYVISKNYGASLVESPNKRENTEEIKKSSFPLVMAVIMDYFYRPISKEPNQYPNPTQLVVAANRKNPTVLGKNQQRPR